MPSPDKGSPAISRRAALSSLALIALAVGVVFGASTRGDFVYDDTRQVMRNPLIQDPSLLGQALTSDVWAFKGDGSEAVSNYWRPTFTSWSVLCFRLFGLKPMGWKLGNLLLHLVACGALFAVLGRLDCSVGLRHACTLLFALHPVHVESVAWIAGAPDLLLASTLLGSLWAVSQWQESGRSGWLGLSLVLYALALGSKEVAFVCAPLFFLLLWSRSPGSDNGFLSGSRLGPRPLVLLSFPALAIGYFVARWRVLGGVSLPVPDSMLFSDLLPTLPSVLWWYLQQVLLPGHLSPSYSLRVVTTWQTPEVWLPLMAVLVAGSVLLLIARKDRFGWFALALFVLPLAPALNVGSFPAEQLVHDRYLYLPLAGFLLLVLKGAEHCSGAVRSDWFSPAASAAVLLIAASLGFSSHRAAANWMSELSLWEHAVAVDPASSFNWSQLGSARQQLGRHEEAGTAYSRALSLRETPRALYGRARSLVEGNDLEKGLVDLERLTQSSSAGAQEAYLLYQAYELLAIAQVQAARPELALAALVQARLRLPMYTAALSEKMAVVLYQVGRKPEALDVLVSAEGHARRELLPESKAVLMRLGMLYAELGRSSEARSKLEEYLAITPAGIAESIDGNRAAAQALLSRLP